jgi:hypothetical protein
MSIEILHLPPLSSFFPGSEPSDSLIRREKQHIQHCVFFSSKTEAKCLIEGWLE